MSLPTSKPNDSIGVKAELAVAHYLAHALPGLGVSIKCSTIGGDAPEFPVLLVRVGSVSVHPDLPPTDGTYNIEVEATLYWSSTDSGRPPQLDEALTEISCAMWDLTSAQAFLNLQNNVVDLRPVGGFHLHDITPNSTGLNPIESEWVETRSWILAVTSADVEFAAAAVAATTAKYLTLGGNYITLGTNRLTLAS